MIKENMKLYRQLGLLRSKIKKDRPSAQEHTDLETLATIATSLDKEVETSTHQEQVTSSIKEREASPKAT